MTLFTRIIRKHDWVWEQRERWSFLTRMKVCDRLWRAAIKAAEGAVR